MKKWLSCLLIGSMLLLCACGTGTPSGTTATTATTTGAGEGNGRPDEPIVRTYAQTYPYVDEDGAVHIRYQDTYTFSSRITELADVSITSKVTGTDTPDERLVTVGVDSMTVTAVGCGSATVKFRKSEQKLIVDPSPLNLLLVSGQSNAEGAHASTAPVKTDDYSRYYLRSPETMAYFTYTTHGLDLTADETSNRHPSAFVVKSLKWGDTTRYGSAVNGPDPTVLCNPNQVFANTGFCAALAYEWIKQTGDRVWIVNASHGGHPINNFMPIGSEGIGDAPAERYNDYEQAVAVYQLALNTVYREVDAGHFTLNHFGYYWMQGESDSISRDTYYLDAFRRLHEGLLSDVVYRHGGVEKSLEFGGILAVRSCKDNSGNSNAELYLTGPRLAQMELGAAASGSFENVWMASSAGDRMTGTDAELVEYLLATYGSEENFRAIFGYDMPKTRAQMHPDIHYAIYGYNELGMDAARNSLMLLYEKYPENCYPVTYAAMQEETTVKLIEKDGYTEQTSIAIDTNAGYGYVIPLITPYYRNSLGVTLVSETEGFRFESFRLYASGVTKSEITFTVNQNGRVLARYTLPVTYGASFSGAENQYAIYGGDPAENPDREVIDIDEGSPWSLGWLNYRNGNFTAFNTVDSDGWLHEAGETKWTPTWHGGFMSGMLGLSDAKGEGLGIRYTVGMAGTVGFRIDQMTNGTADVRFAIFKNGELLWPFSADPDNPDDHSEWYILYCGSPERAATTAAQATSRLEEITVSVSEGDELVFVFEKVSGTPQKYVYPAIYYISEN